MTPETADDGTVGLSSRQVDCARLIATSPGRSKQDIAASLKISRRTVFRWLADEAFQRKVEELRRSRIVASDAKSVLAMLSKKDKRELMTLLLAERENRHLDLPEIEELERKIMEVAEGDHDPLQKVTKGAIEKVELLLGRLRRNALYDRDYEPDGSPIKRTLREFVDELMETAVIATSLGENKQLARAVAETWNLIGQRMGEEENRHQEWEKSNGDDAYNEERGGDDLGDEEYDLDDNTEEWEDME